MEIKQTKLIIDTDIGTDVDDMFALVYAIKNPLADLKAVTTVHGNTQIRAKIARKLERMLGVNIPVIAGCSGDSKYWCGFEHLALTNDEEKEPLDTTEFNIPVYDSDTKLVCIGPLTNISYQLEKNPIIKKIKKIYVMGSSAASHNFFADAEATEKIFSEKNEWCIYQITKEVSKKINFDKNELKELRGNALGDFLCDSALRWLEFTGRERAIMYDVLAVSSALAEKGENFVKFREEGKNFISYDVDMKLKEKLVEMIKNA